MIAILQSVWAGLGEAGHTVIYLGCLSILSLLATKLPGTAGTIAKKIVDFFSANLAHK